jgi:hypothetical protein
MPRIDLDILNQKQTPAFYASSLATRPAASFVGRVFIDTDSPSTGMYRDTGTAWVSIAVPASAISTPTLQTVTAAGNTTTAGIAISTLTAGSVIFAGAAGLLSEDNTNLFWDDTNNFLGIGPTGGPTALLDIHSATQNIFIQVNATSTNNSQIAFLNGGTGKWRVGNLYNAAANDFIIYDTTNATNRLTVKNTGSSTLNGVLTLNGSTTAIGAIARGLYSNNTLNASANNDVLIGIDINTNFNNGSFTNVANFPLRIRGTNFAEIQCGLTTGSYLDGLIYRPYLTNTGRSDTTPSYTYSGYGTLGIGFTSTDVAMGFFNGGLKMKLFSTGNLSIGITTDNGKKLQVNGTTTTSGFAASGATYTVSATVSEQYYHVFTGAVGQTLTLLSPSSNNLQYVIINNSANTLTVAAAASTNIVNTVGSSVSTITLIANQRVFLIADGNNKYYQIF